MNLTEIRTAHFKPLLQEALKTGYPRHAAMDYGVVFGTCVDRGMQLWKNKIAPEYGPERAPVFEKALWRVRMLAATSIPWPMGFGYAFGAACHALAGGRSADRDEAATTSALAMFLVGLFDHLFDKHPHEFGAIGKLVTAEALERYVLERDLSSLSCDPDQVLAAGWVSLYRLYFSRGHRQLGAEKYSPTSQLWLQSLVRMHAAEAASASLKISTVTPTTALIESSESPGTYSFWIVGLSACLGLDTVAIRSMEPFANGLTRLTRLIDSIVDVDEDIRQDLWGGLAVRLALDATDQAAADRIVMEVIEECVLLLQALANGPAATLTWKPEDPFTLVDIFWAYLWNWAGGPTPGWSPAPPVFPGAATQAMARP